MSFIIHISSCRSLRPKGRISKRIDPYVKLHLGQQPKQKTKVVKNSLNPSYDESFTYQTWGEEDLLRVSVWSHDRLSQNQCIGEIYISYPRHSSGVLEQEYALLSPSRTSRRTFQSPSSEPPSPPFSTSATSPLTSPVPPSPKVSLTSRSKEEKQNGSSSTSESPTVMGYITLTITNSKLKEEHEKQQEIENKQKEEEEKKRMEMQIIYAREELASRLPKKEEPEPERKRPTLSIELPEILRKTPTATIVHSPPKSGTAGGIESRPLTSSADTPLPHTTTKGGDQETPTPKEDAPCCVLCHKDISCIIL